MRLRLAAFSAFLAGALAACSVVFAISPGPLIHEKALNNSSISRSKAVTNDTSRQALYEYPGGDQQAEDWEEEGFVEVSGSFSGNKKEYKRYKKQYKALKKSYTNLHGKKKFKWLLYSTMVPILQRSMRR